MWSVIFPTLSSANPALRLSFSITPASGPTESSFLLVDRLPGGAVKRKSTGDNTVQHRPQLTISLHQDGRTLFPVPVFHDIGEARGTGWSTCRCHG